MAITPINSFDVPVNNADFDTWGLKLIAIFNSIDTLLGSPANTIKGNNTGGLTPTANLTTTQVAAMLPTVVGDSGAGGTKGMVPAPAAGDAAAGKVLGAGGGWVATRTRAIGRFNGTTGAAVVASGVSVVRTGTGLYTVTLSPAMADTNYIIDIIPESPSFQFNHALIPTKTTSTFTIETRTPATLQDPAFLNIVILTV